jgi:ATP-dependent helicase/nuclease subunit B
VRVTGAVHPRLKILGAIEARLVQADRLVLAGLEEGTWPRGAPIDPFLSRPMRKTLGLPSPERQVGLSAHDFAQAACAPRVALVHSERRAGAPAVESRWLWRLRTLARGAGLGVPGRPEVLAWARRLDAPDTVEPAPRPAPTPPVEVRPKKLSVTRIERWLRDPYETYARYILRLKVLDPPDQPVGPRERGTAVHEALERFARDHDGELPDEAETLIRLYLEEALRAAGLPEGRMARETALARNLAPWLIDLERRRRPGATLRVEEEGTLTLQVAGQPFILTAKADRLEVRGDLVDIIDFKTGQAPSAKQVREHLAPQLTLTAAILKAGGFSALPGKRVPGDLVYVQVKGGRTVGLELVRASGDESGVMADAAREKLERRIAAFMNPNVAYLSRAMPQFISDAGDYDHLARVREWSVAADDDAGGGE